MLATNVVGTTEADVLDDRPNVLARKAVVITETDVDDTVGEVDGELELVAEVTAVEDISVVLVVVSVVRVDEACGDVGDLDPAAKAVVVPLVVSVELTDAVRVVEALVVADVVKVVVPLVDDEGWTVGDGLKQHVVPQLLYTLGMEQRSAARNVSHSS